MAEPQQYVAPVVDEEDAPDPLDAGGYWIQLYHNKVLALFGGLGKALTRVPLLFILASLIVFAVLTAGVYDLEESSSITQLWAISGTRGEDERAFFESAFGGATRNEALMAVHPTNVLTADSFNEVIAGLSLLLVETEGTTTAPAGSVFLDSTDSSGAAMRLTQKDMCSAPTVPAVWRRTPVDAATGRPFTLTGDGSVAYAYQRLTVCLEGVGGLTALEAGWGIARFPCRTLSVLDCFREGGFAYPSDLAELQVVAPTVSQHPALATCIGTVEAELVGFFSVALGSAAAGQAAADPIIAGLESSIRAFASFGYWYRPSFNSVSITDHISAGLTNLADPAIGTAECVGGAPCCVAWSGTKVPSSLWLGEVVYNADGTIARSTAIQNPVINANDHDPVFIDRIDARYGAATTRAQRTEWTEAFELKIVDAWLNFRDNTAVVNGYNVAVERSNGDIVSDSTELDGVTLALGYIIMIAFVIWAFGNWKCPFSKESLLDSHIVLGLAGVAVIALSTIASFGVAGWFGIVITPLNSNILPFLALGLGLDDLFVLLHTFHIIQERTLTAHMRKTWELAGPSILLTSLSNFTAFIITSITPLFVIENFSYQMSVAVVLNFFFLVTLFGPLMVWDVKRQLAGRADLVFAKWGKPADLHAAPHGEKVVIDASDEGFVNKFYGPLLTNPLVKFVVVAAFGTLLGIMAWRGFDHNEFGIRPSDIALEGTYQHDYINRQEVSFPSYTTSVVSRPANFAAAQSGLVASQEAVQLSRWVDQSTSVIAGSWHTSVYEFALDANASYVDQTARTINDEWFDAMFASWITTTGSVFSDDVACRNRATGARTLCSQFDAANDELFAAKLSVVQVDMVETPDVVQAIEYDQMVFDLYNTLDSRNDNFAVGYIFTFWEQYIHIEDELFKIAAYSLLGVFIATLSFQFSVSMSMILVCVILMIDIEVYGVIEVIGAKVNGFSVANVVMSIGLSVEFCAHLARAFLVAKGSHDERMVKSLVEMFTPVTYGALSSFLPLIPLAFSDQSFFVTYYFEQFSFMILFAYLNGVVLLPVILSLVGPNSLPLKDHVDDEEEPVTKPATLIQGAAIEMASPSAVVPSVSPPDGSEAKAEPQATPVTAV